MDKNNDINKVEAGAVAFTSIKTPEGFTWNVTFRDLDGKAVVARIIGFQEYCKEHTWTPVENFRGYQKKEKVFVEGRVCPKCGGRVEEKLTKTSKKFFKCENGKWNPTTKQAFGCPWVEWENEFQKDIQDSGVDIPEEELDKYVG